MNTVGTAPTNLTTADLASASRKTREQVLRRTVQEMVGMTFYGEMLRIARNSPLKSERFHGGRGEEVFGSQLDAEFARQAGMATRGGLVDAIYNRLAPHL